MDRNLLRIRLEAVHSYKSQSSVVLCIVCPEFFFFFERVLDIPLMLTEYIAIY